MYGFVGGYGACVHLNMQAVWGSAAMATPKKGGFRLVSDFGAANQRVEKVPGVMPNQEVSTAKLSEAKFYGSLDLLQGYWQCPLTPEAQEIFTIATLCGLYTPTRVPKGNLSATSHVQATLTRAGGAELHDLCRRCDLLGFRRD